MLCQRQTETDRDRQRQTETETDRDRQTETDRQRQTDRDRQTQTDRHRQTDTDRQTQTDRHRQTDTETDRDSDERNAIARWKVRFRESIKANGKEAAKWVRAPLQQSWLTNNPHVNRNYCAGGEGHSEGWDGNNLVPHEQSAEVALPELTGEDLKAALATKLGGATGAENLSVPLASARALHLRGWIQQTVGQGVICAVRGRNGLVTSASKDIECWIHQSSELPFGELSFDATKCFDSLSPGTLLRIATAKGFPVHLAEAVSFGSLRDLSATVPMLRPRFWLTGVFSKTMPLVSALRFFGALNGKARSGRKLARKPVLLPI